jgi:hypothetical protein
MAVAAATAIPVGITAAVEEAVEEAKACGMVLVTGLMTLGAISASPLANIGGPWRNWGEK